MNNELYHYGIKGMKWGVRRYQNEDGSLTSRGVKRYATKGYAQDSYNSNKTKAGKAWDLYTGAHKTVGKAMYDTSSNAANKRRAEKYIADQKAAKEAKAAQKNTAKANKKQIREGINDAGLSHPTAYWMNRHAKNAAASGVAALATASVGSAATYALAKKGKTQAAAKAYTYSKTLFDTFATSAKIQVGAAAVNAMMGGAATNRAYQRDVKKVREKYKN